MNKDGKTIAFNNGDRMTFSQYVAWLEGKLKDRHNVVIDQGEGVVRIVALLKKHDKPILNQPIEESNQ